MKPADDGPGPALRTERFTALREDGLADQRLEGWFDAMKFGFHEGRADPADVVQYAESYAADARILTAVYDDAERPGVWDPAIPVATYATMVNTVNTGGTLLPAHLVTTVTVRPTHRRRGLLRRLITEDLHRAAEDGLALAALVASEATIYGRFGFGAAAFARRVHVDVRERFALRPQAAAAAGTVEVTDPEALAVLAPEIFARFHARTPGSVGRQFSYAQMVSGRWQQHKPEPDRTLRAALCYGDGGSADGYVCYRFAGWDSSPRTVKVVDLVAATPEAYLGLWRYLGSIDLVERIDWPLAPVEDPLPWALQDPRGYEVRHEEDALWLRVLDPAAALQARSYAADGSVTLEIIDPLGLAAGRWRLTAGGGSAAVEPLAPGAAVDLVLGADVLGSLYLGGTSARTLAAAGRLAGEPEAVQRLDRLMARPVRPYCITHF